MSGGSESRIKEIENELIQESYELSREAGRIESISSMLSYSWKGDAAEQPVRILHRLGDEIEGAGRDIELIAGAIGEK